MRKHSTTVGRKNTICQKESSQNQVQGEAAVCRGCLWGERRQRKALSGKKHVYYVDIYLPANTHHRGIVLCFLGLILHFRFPAGHILLTIGMSAHDSQSN